MRSCWASFCCVGGRSPHDGVIELPLFDPTTVHRRTFANGLRLLVHRDSSAPVVAVVTWVRAGYFDETDDVVGISHVLEHMFFKGTPTRAVGEISRETKAAGGYLNAGTIYDHTSYYTVLPSSGFARGLEIQFDAYANSVIDAEELSRELEVIVEEAKRKADDPSAVTIETLYEVLHDHHRMRRWRMGHEPELRALTREHVVDFYRNFYRPGNTLLVIVGDVEPEQVFEHVARLHGSLDAGDVRRSPGAPEPERVGFRFRELSGDVMQTQVAFGFRTPGTMHGDTPLLHVAATVLGAGRASRLFRAVRERKLAAAVSAFNYTPTELGVFVMHAEGQPSTAHEGALAAWEQVCDLRDAGVGRDELWRARRVLESRWIRRLETMEGQANYLVEWEAQGDWTLGERFLQCLLTAEPEQVTDAIRRYLELDRAAVVTYRPAAAEPLAGDAGELERLLAKVRARPITPPPPRVPWNPPALQDVPRLEGEIAGISVFRTGTGVPILVRRKSGGRLLHLAVHARGGAPAEGEELAGMTALLVRTALKGTVRRTAAQVAEDAELLGGGIAPLAGADSFGWTTSVPISHAEAAIELLADVVLTATFPDEGLETERAVALADLAQLRDDMYRFPMRLLVQAAFAGHPYGVPVSGTDASLGGIDVDGLRRWHGAWALGGELVIAAVGDMDQGELAAAIARCFAQLRHDERPALPPPSWPASPVSVSASRGKAQTALALAFPGPAHRDSDRFATRLIAGVASGLGGRFFEELRDRQALAYTVTAAPLERRLAGAFVAYIATSPEKEDAARRGLLEQFARLRDQPVSSDELDRARAYALGTHAIRQQSSAALLGEMIDAWLLGEGLHQLAEYEARLRAVTPSHMQDAARRYFDETRLVEAVVRGDTVKSA